VDMWCSTPWVAHATIRMADVMAERTRVGCPVLSHTSVERR